MNKDPKNFGYIFENIHHDASLPKEKRLGCVTRPNAYFHNLSRWTAIQHISNDWVFIIDADELPDGQLVSEWLSNFTSSDLNPSTCYKLACHWYFKAPENQAIPLEDSILLIHRSHLTEANIFGDDERDHLIRASKNKLLIQVKDLQGRVMWHHFSFVRGKEGLIKKLSTWGHSDDLFKEVDPAKFVGYIYHNEGVNDIVHQYSYVQVSNKFGIRM